MPENMHVTTKQGRENQRLNELWYKSFVLPFFLQNCKVIILGPMMTLSEAVLDAIKNKTYSLRPLKKEDARKKRNSNQDLGISQILARRMAMGYKDIQEEEERKESSIISIM